MVTLPASEYQSISEQATSSGRRKGNLLTMLHHMRGVSTGLQGYSTVTDNAYVAGYLSADLNVVLGQVDQVDQVDQAACCKTRRRTL